MDAVYYLGFPKLSDRPISVIFFKIKENLNNKRRPQFSFLLFPKFLCVQDFVSDAT